MGAAWMAASVCTVWCCSRRRSCSSASVNHDPKVYGSTSGGMSPSTRPITMNGAPMMSVPGSLQYSGGTGAVVRCPTYAMSRNWLSRS